ncbi:MAG: DUF6544 family protein [Vicinamibacterales bacterium]
MTWWLGGAFVLLTIAIAALGLGRSRWQRTSAALSDALVDMPGPTAADAGRAGMPDDLPAPVARWFQRAMPAGAPPLIGVELRQEGDFRTGAGEETWRPFTAWQRFRADVPGFIWAAEIRMAPMMPVFVRDSYVDGRGRMQASLLGLRTMVDESGKPELDAGALLRYLAEAVWFPPAWRPGRGVTWTGIDDRSARVTLTDRGTTVSGIVRFTDQGDVAEFFSPDRFREVSGAYVPTPWLVRCAAHAEFSGFRVPTECEVIWQLPEGPQPYWRGRVVDVRYDFGS